MAAEDHADLFTVSEELLQQFAAHTSHLRDARRARKVALELKTLVNSDTSQTAAHAGAVVELGERLPTDTYDGDAVLRTLLKLLAMVDERGYQRSSQQLRFHDAFIRATSRVIYRDNWSRSEPEIRAKNNWLTTPSEILISTPRRFGKTFRCASHT